MPMNTTTTPFGFKFHFTTEWSTFTQWTLRNKNLKQYFYTIQSFHQGQTKHQILGGQICKG